MLSLIVAMDRNQLIGRDNRLPWHLSADLKRFKRITMGKPIVMGRRTHESIGKPLPGRTNIVVSTDRHYQAAGCRVVASLHEALSAAGEQEVFVIGGASLYEQALPLAGRMYVTEIDAAFEGDTWFPEFDPGEWQETAREAHPADAGNAYAFAFVVLDRRAAA